MYIFIKLFYGADEMLGSSKIYKYMLFNASVWTLSPAKLPCVNFS